MDDIADMKVALVFKSLSKNGGAEVMAQTILKVLSSLDVRLTLLARHVDAKKQNFEFIQVSPFHFGRIGRSSGFARAVCRKLQNLDVDLVLSQEYIPCCHVYRADGGAHAEWLRQRRRVLGPLKRAWNWLDPHQNSKLRLEQATYESEDLRAVICISPMVKDDILRHYKISPNKLHVIENAIDLEDYQRPNDIEAYRKSTRTNIGVPANAYLWLFVGKGFTRKGLDIALQALAHRPKMCHLIVVGKDHKQKSYQRLAKRLGIDHRVHFMGNQPDVRPYYWTVDALIHPALYEAYGLVVLEAMAAGLPVLGSYQCGAANSLVRDDQNGYLRDALDLEGWVDAMARTETALNPESFIEAAVAAAAKRNLQQLEAEVKSLICHLLDRDKAQIYPAQNI